jgi:uncharacterized protein (DUF433 family)
MVALAKDYLGVGMYTTAEAAMYARIAPQTMRRWLFGTSRDSAVFSPLRSDPEHKTVAFLDLIQSLAIRAIREERAIPLQKIRQAIETAQSLGVSFPFARKHKIFLLGEDIHIEGPAFPQQEKGDLIQASGRQRRQYVMRPVVELYLDDLTFGRDGLATKYRVYESAGVQIKMDPTIHFGEPLTPSGYTAWTLWEACRAEGSPTAAAKAYGVPEIEVRVAFRYIDSIRPTTRE